ncbi:MAG: signal peptidase I [Oscillospiraceae bacterium]|nr:signal peptidase I [Oscillospiraceae bacterium]
MDNQNISIDDNAAEGITIKKDKVSNVILSYLHDLTFLIAGVLLVFSLLLRVVVVSGPSMDTTLTHGDWLLLLGNVFYQEPKHGDIIVASKDSYDNGTPIIKRVIALEGQTVDIDFQAGVVYVDGVALDEPYTNTPTNLQEGIEFPLTVDEGCIFVMGDNRNVSKDSRSTEIGLIDRREILGKAILLMFPGDNNGRDFGRIGVIS